ncbi:MAG: hypothetical protein HYX60_01865 [Legionella longbeachae]|nr:hypothetical protein [Legionella longbeachae]
MKGILNLLILCALTLHVPFAYSLEGCPPLQGPCAVASPRNISLSVKANFDKAPTNASLHLMNYCSNGSVELNKKNPTADEKFLPSTVVFVLCLGNKVQDTQPFEFSNDTNLVCQISNKIICNEQ